MTLKVLSVDDSKTIRMIVKKAFRPYQCEVFEAENGAEGFETAQRVKPDLIVLDITMPVMNGVEMLGKLKADPDLKNTPVIMLTAESGKDNVMQLVRMGVRDYVVKPFKDVQLIERAKNIVTLESAAAEGEETSESQSRYFVTDQSALVINIPEKMPRPVIADIEGQLQAKIKESFKGGVRKVIMDLSRAADVSMSLVKLVILAVETAQGTNMAVRIVGSPSLANEFKGFSETSSLPIHGSIDDARAV